MTNSTLNIFISCLPASNMKEYSPYLLWLAVIIAAVTPFLDTAYLGTVAVIQLIIGILIGWFNIEKKETVPFLVAAIALGIAYGPFVELISKITVLVDFFKWLASALYTFSLAVYPAAFIVGLKTVIAAAKD